MMDYSKFKSFRKMPGEKTATEKSSPEEPETKNHERCPICLWSGWITGKVKGVFYSSPCTCHHGERIIEKSGWVRFNQDIREEIYSQKGLELRSKKGGLVSKEEGKLMFADIEKFRSSDPKDKMTLEQWRAKWERK